MKKKKERPGISQLYRDTGKAVVFRDIPGVIRIVGRYGFYKWVYQVIYMIQLMGS